MINMSHTASEGSIKLTPTGVGMTTGDKAALFPREVKKIERARQFRRAGRDFDDLFCQEVFVFPAHRITTTCRWVSPDFVCREIGAIEMDTSDASAVRRRPSSLHVLARFDHTVELLERARSRCRED